MSGFSESEQIPNAPSIEDWCEHDEGPLRHLLHRAQAFERLHQLAAAALPEDLARHTRLACVRDETLIIAADSAAWATRARLQGDLWLDTVRQYWPGSIRQLKFRVQPPRPQASTEVRPRQLNPTVCDHLAECAQHQSDPEMAAILLRLAQKRRG